MGTKNFSSANDLITFSRASGGTALRKVAYGPELVTNGTFDSDLTAWTDASTGSESASVSSGQLVLNRVDSSNSAKVYQAITTNAGGVYAITLDISDAGLYVRAGTGTSGSSAYNLLNENGIGNALNFRFVATGSTTYITIGPATANGVTGTVDNVSVKEVLFDQGDLTLFNHPADIPRIEYDADGNVLGLLVEESRTNLLTYSEDFSVGAWRYQDAAIDDNSGNGYTDPNGTNNAFLLYPSVSTTAAFIYRLNPNATKPNNTISVFAKAQNKTWCFLATQNSPPYGTYFNLSTGTVGTQGSNVQASSITAVGDGWYKLSVVLSSGLDVLYFEVFPVDGDGSRSVTANSTDGIYIWGAQLEAGAFPTSYIPTDGATATRSADVASIPVADFGYNQSEGSLVVDANPIPSGSPIGDQGIVSFDNGTTTDEIILMNENNDRCRLIIDPSGGAANDVNMNLSGAEGSEKYAAAWRINDAQIAHGGLIGAGDTSTTPPTTITRLNVGSVPNIPLNGHIKSIKYYPRRLSNAQLQELTT